MPAGGNQQTPGARFGDYCAWRGKTTMPGENRHNSHQSAGLFERKHQIELSERITPYVHDCHQRQKITACQ
jgi:hypothetical protein